MLAFFENLNIDSMRRELSQCKPIAEFIFVGALRGCAKGCHLYFIKEDKIC
jgi:hypothetical protein